MLASERGIEGHRTWNSELGTRNTDLRLMKSLLPADLATSVTVPALVPKYSENHATYPPPCIRHSIPDGYQTLLLEISTVAVSRKVSYMALSFTSFTIL